MEDFSLGGGGGDTHKAGTDGGRRRVSALASTLTRMGSKHIHFLTYDRQKKQPVTSFL